MSATPEKSRIPADGRHESNRAAELLRAVSILVVDDEPGMQNFLSRALSSTCAALHVAGSVEEGEALRQRHHFDLMVVDIRLPGLSGIEWLRQLREQGNQTDVIFITAFADLEMAVEALRAGASDFLLKPFRLEQILTATSRCLERREVLRENLLLRRQVDLLQPPVGIIGESRSIKRTCQLIKQVAPRDTTVLIEGETGTGKELVARAIHEYSGRSGPFVAINCGSVPPDLIESELFGHTKGAFTGAVAARDGLFSYARDGTLFLDEISEMPMVMQAKLLRVLEEKTVRPVGAEKEHSVSARVIAATNRRLADRVNSGRFRQDLYYRLEVITLAVPPLRERPEDIPLLVEYFVQKIAPRLGVDPAPLSHHELRELQNYAWPGNVRELKNVIERYLLLGQLPGDLTGGAKPTDDPENLDTENPVDWSMAAVERKHILRVLDAADGNKSEAARRLGLSRKTLERKLASWRSTRSRSD